MTESHMAWGRKFLELSLPGAKVPGSESSWERKFQELSLLGAKVPGNESSRERKFHTMVLSLPGAKVLRSESSIILFWAGADGAADAVFRDTPSQPVVVTPPTARRHGLYALPD